MTKHGHMPPVPPANQAHKGPVESSDAARDKTLKHLDPKNTAEQGDTANIRQNTTNKGFFQGRRVK